MSFKVRIRKAVLVLVLAAARPATAGVFFSSDDQGVRGPSVLRTPMGVRALGMGGAYVAAADDASSVYWNPAGLQRVPRKELQVLYARTFADQSQQSVSYAYPAWRAGERETWGVGATLLDVASFDVKEGGQTVGVARPQETVVGLSHAGYFRQTAWGVTGKTVRVRTFEQYGRAYALDAGFSGFFRNNAWNWALAFANIGRAVRIGDSRIGLPTAARGGVSFQGRMGVGAIVAAGQWEIPAGDKPLASAGIEFAAPLAAQWRAALRTGFQNRGAGRWSFGFGIGRESFEVNYAMASYTDLSNAQRMDVVFRFGAALAPEVERGRLLTETRASLAEGEMAQARERWNRLHQLSPRRPEVLQLGRDLRDRLAESVQPETLLAEGEESFARGDLARAAESFQKLLIVDATHREGRAWLAKTEARIAAERSVRLQEEVSKKRAREVRSSVKRALEHEARGQWPEAIKAWLTVQSLGEKGEETGKHIREAREQVYASAEQALSAGNLEKAWELFRALDGPRAFRDARERAKSLGDTLFRRRQEEALALYRQGIEAYAKGYLTEAQNRFEESLRLNPQDKTVRQALEQVREELKMGKTP